MSREVQDALKKKYPDFYREGATCKEQLTELVGEFNKLIALPEIRQLMYSGNGKKKEELVGPQTIYAGKFKELFSQQGDWVKEVNKSRCYEKMQFASDLLLVNLVAILGWKASREELARSRGRRFLEVGGVTASDAARLTAWDYKTPFNRFDSLIQDPDRIAGLITGTRVSESTESRNQISLLMYKLNRRGAGVAPGLLPRLRDIWEGEDNELEVLDFYGDYPAKKVRNVDVFLLEKINRFYLGKIFRCEELSAADIENDKRQILKGPFRQGSLQLKNSTLKYGLSGSPGELLYQAPVSHGVQVAEKTARVLAKAMLSAIASGIGSGSESGRDQAFRLIHPRKKVVRQSSVNPAWKR